MPSINRKGFLGLLLHTLLLSLAPVSVLSQDFTLRAYTTADGLCDNQVYSLLQDSRGFLWIGTAEGLSRFDGAGFRNFFSGTRGGAYFPSNYINAMVEYKPRHILLLFGTRLGCADLDRNQFYRPPEPFQQMTVQQIVQLPGNRLIIAGKDSLYQTGPDLRIIRTWPLPFREPGIAGCKILVLTNDSLLISNQREHYLGGIATGKFSRFLPDLVLTEEQNLITWHAYDTATKTLYGSNFWKGLWQFNLRGAVKKYYHTGPSGGRLSTNHIGSLLLMSDSVLYIGTMNGLNKVDPREDPSQKPASTFNTESSFSGKPVLHLIRDRDGSVWMGTNAGLLKQVPAKGVRVADGDNPLTPMNSEWSVVTRGPDRQLYAGTLNEGVWKLTNNSGLPQRLSKIPVRMVWVLQPQSDALLAGGNGPSLFRYFPQKDVTERTSFLQPFYSRSDILTLFYRDRYGDEWYSLNQGGGLIRKPAGRSGLLHYHRGQQPAPFQVGYLALAAEDAGGSVWFAVNKSNSVLQWDPRREAFREWSLEELTGLKGRKFGGVQALLGGADSVLWISSESTGLIAYHTGRRQARLFTREEGLPTAYIYGLTRDHRGRLWMATARGLICFLEKENRFAAFRRQQGLPDEDFSSGLCWFDSVTCKLFAGSSNKLIMTDPDRLTGTARDSIVLFLDEVRINGRDSEERLSVRVPHSSNDLQLAFTGVDLENGNELEYMYRLNGADPDWVYAGDKKTAFYHQLPPGSYRFEVRARYKGENGWRSGAELFRVMIRKAWWQTWVFRTGLLLLGLLVAWQLIRQYLRRKLRLQRQHLEQELAVEQERIRLARELHDGLGSQLSGVKHSFSALRNRLPLPAENAALFDHTLEKLNDSINELRNVSHSMLSSGFLEEGLETAVRNYVAALSGKGPLQIQVQSLIREPLVLGAEKSFHLFRIVQELLQNILKHAGATEALIQLSSHDQRLHITVEDNGRGFDSTKPENQRGMGWRNVETRLRLIGGRAELRTTSGTGTSVEIEVPLSD